METCNPFVLSGRFFKVGTTRTEESCGLESKNGGFLNFSECKSLIDSAIQVNYRASQKPHVTFPSSIRHKNVTFAIHLSQFLVISHAVGAPRSDAQPKSLQIQKPKAMKAKALRILSLLVIAAVCFASVGCSSSGTSTKLGNKVKSDTHILFEGAF